MNHFTQISKFAAMAAEAAAKQPADFVLQGHRIEKEMRGDLDKDGVEDVALTT